MNDDPIKENNPFRIGLDNLTGNDEINSGIEYNDLHNCSNDLSDRGSRIEEIAHAKFAEAQRRNTYKNTYSASSERVKKVVITKNPKNIITGIIVAYIAFNLVGTVIASIIGGIGSFVSNTSQESYIPSYEYSYNDTVVDGDYNYEGESVIPNFTVETDIMKENVHIEAGKSDNGNLMIRLENQAPDTMYSTRVQLIFFDAENKPISVTDLNVYTLYSNETETIEVHNIPEYTSYNFLISDRYADDTPYASEYYEY